MRSAVPLSPATSLASRRCRGWRPPYRGLKLSGPGTSAYGRCRTGCRGSVVNADMYGRVVRPVLFRLGKGDAEVAHERTLHGLRLLGRVPGAAAALSRAFGASASGTER